MKPAVLAVAFVVGCAPATIVQPSLCERELREALARDLPTSRFQFFAPDSTVITGNDGSRRVLYCVEADQ